MTYEKAPENKKKKEKRKKIERNRGRRKRRKRKSDLWHGAKERGRKEKKKE